jgi:hypothetical protein
MGVAIAAGISVIGLVFLVSAVSGIPFVYCFAGTMVVLAVAALDLT